MLWLIFMTIIATQELSDLNASRDLYTESPISYLPDTQFWEVFHFWLHHLGPEKKSLRRGSVLVSILSTWHKLKSFGKMQTSTKEVPSSEWPKGKSAGYLLGWCQLWAGGPRRGKEGNWIRSWENTSAQHSSWVLLQLLPLGCCLEFLLWLLSMMNCDLEV